MRLIERYCVSSLIHFFGFIVGKKGVQPTVQALRPDVRGAPASKLCATLQAKLPVVHPDFFGFIVGKKGVQPTVQVLRRCTPLPLRLHLPAPAICNNPKPRRESRRPGNTSAARTDLFATTTIRSEADG